MTIKNLPEDTVCLYVYGEKETGKTFRFINKIKDNNVLSDEFEPALIFPVEEQITAKTGNVYCSMWFAWKNVLGIQCLNASEWSITVCGEPDEKIKYYLRDVYGEIKEVTYGNSHHALYFPSWSSYDRSVAEFSREVEALKKEFDDLFIQTAKKYPITSGLVDGDIAVLEKWYEFTKWHKYWREHFFDWIENKHPEKTRLFWAKERLKEVKIALKEKRNELFSEFKVNPECTGGYL